MRKFLFGIFITVVFLGVAALVVFFNTAKINGTADQDELSMEEISSSAASDIDDGENDSDSTSTASTTSTTAAASSPTTTTASTTTTVKAAPTTKKQTTTKKKTTTTTGKGHYDDTGHIWYDEDPYVFPGVEDYISYPDGCRHYDDGHWYLSPNHKNGKCPQYVEGCD